MRNRSINCYLFTLLFIAFAVVSFNRAVAQCTSSIIAFPYTEDFETTNGNWTTGGYGSDWAWGAPTKPVINKAASGNNCWITAGLNTVGYNDNEQGWLQSPCFDLTSLKNPYITFSVFWETEDQYDGASLQYSLDKGSSWQTLGAYEDASCGDANWFNNSSITYMTGGSSAAGWSGNIQQPSGNCRAGGGSGQWLKAKHSLATLAGQPNVMFRFMFVAGKTCNAYDGFAIDDISIQDTPPVITITGQVKNVSCPGSADGSVIINASGGSMPYTYTWDPNAATTSSALHLAANKYTIVVTDMNGCEVSVLETVSGPAGFTNTVITTDATCRLDDGAATLTISGGTAPYNYTWDILQVPDTVSISNTAHVNKINTLAPGDYIAKITDANGCSFTTNSFHISEQAPLKISLGADTVICPDGKFTISPGNFQSYLWQDNSTAPAFTVTNAGTYSVSVRDINGCNASASLNVSSGDCNGVYFPSAFSPNGDGINDEFGMVGKTGPIKNYHLLIYNRWGQIVFESFSPSEKWNGNFNGSAASNETFVWTATFTVNDQKAILKGTVIAIQ